MTVGGAGWNDLGVRSGVGGQPPSFHYENTGDWAMWVLDHGLPMLPEELGEDDEVPIAYWAGPAFGSVLFRSWWSSAEGEVREGEADVNDEHYSYVRTEEGWEPTGASGGTAGPEDNPLRPRPRVERLASFGGEWQEGPVRGLTGVVGSAARFIELIDSHGRTRRPVEAPLGWVVVCFDASEEVTIRVLDADDQPLHETIRSPAAW